MNNFVVLMIFLCFANVSLSQDKLSEDAKSYTLLHIQLICNSSENLLESFIRMKKENGLTLDTIKHNLFTPYANKPSSYSDEDIMRVYNDETAIHFTKKCPLRIIQAINLKSNCKKEQCKQLINKTIDLVQLMDKRCSNSFNSSQKILSCYEEFINEY